MNTPAIETTALHKNFRKQRVLLGVDLCVPKGTVVGLLGTNGAGKTTLIKCLLGLLRANGGESRLLDEDPWQLSAEAKERLGYVPQEIRLYPWMTGQQVIDYTAAFYRRWDDDWTQELTAQWELPLDQRVGTLSIGQQQKLALVLAMGHRPDLLILDEPVGSLDPLARREFLKSLLQMVSDKERTVLFSTHITSDLERVASHVAILRDGKIVYFDELDVLKDHVKRLRITAPVELPATFSVQGELRREVLGRTAIVAVPNVNDELLESLRREWNADVAVEDLNLEEIFLEMHDA